MSSAFLYPADDERCKMKLSSHHARSDLCARPAGGGAAWSRVVGAGGRRERGGGPRGDSEGGTCDGDPTRPDDECIGSDDWGPGRVDGYGGRGDGAHSGKSDSSSESGESDGSSESGKSDGSSESDSSGGAGAL